MFFHWFFGTTYISLKGQNVNLLDFSYHTNKLKFSFLCYGQFSRYIGTEFIFYMISPIFLLLLKYSPQLGVSLSLTTVVLSSLMKLRIMKNDNYPPIPLHFGSSKFFRGTFVEVSLCNFFSLYDMFLCYREGVLEKISGQNLSYRGLSLYLYW